MCLKNMAAKLHLDLEMQLKVVKCFTFVISDNVAYRLLSLSFIVQSSFRYSLYY